MITLLAMCAFAHALYVDMSPPSDTLGHWEVDLYDASGNQRGTTSNPMYFGRTWALTSSNDQVSAVQSGSWNILNVTGTVSLPTGAATSSNQSSEISSLQAIQAGTAMSLGQKTMSASEPVVIASDQSSIPVQQLDGSKLTYSAAVNNLAASATAPSDVFTITGSASKVVRILRLGISGAQTTAGQRDVFLIKRSTANSGGTSTAILPVPHDSTNAAATATVLAYTANPTLGTALGTVRSAKLYFGTTATDSDNWYWDFGVRPGQAIVLRGTSQVLAVSLNGLVGAGNTIDISVEFTEE